VAQIWTKPKIFDPKIFDPKIIISNFFKVSKFPDIRVVRFLVFKEYSGVQDI
jgi:hypothetical protein